MNPGINNARTVALMSLLAGGAFGTVLSMLPAILVPLMAVWIRGEKRLHRMLWAVGLFLAGYFVTNPYVLLHLLGLGGGWSLLRGQLGNSTAMYSVSGISALWSALTTAGFYLVMLTPAVLTVLVAAVLWYREKRGPLVLWTLGPATAASLLIFVALAAGKPGEYARFALLPATFGILTAGWLAGRFRQSGPLMIVVIALHLWLGLPELGRYMQDARSDAPRWRDAAWIRDRQAGGEFQRVTLKSEPAPYNTPPINLWDTKLILLPRYSAEEPVLRQPPESDGVDRMSWASRTIQLARE